MRTSRANSLVSLVAASALFLACSDSSVTALGDLSASASPVTELVERAGVPTSGIYRVVLTSLNQSGVHGTATMAVRKGDLAVVLNAVGHEVGQVHAQHIHGFTDGTSGSCPPPGYDPDGDGLLMIGEGLPFYGPVQLPLTPFPTPANQAGAISYKVSFPIDGLAFPVEDLELKTVVLHGRTVDGSYIGSLPVACGMVERVN